MPRITAQDIELFARKLRADSGLSEKEPIHVKTLICKLGVITKYRPLSKKSYGLSLQTADHKFKFILVNSNSSRGRQHFTIAHELYHLYFDPNPSPHICEADERDRTERLANTFASALLLPSLGVMEMIPKEELQSGEIRIPTVLRLEQYFSVSHEAMVNRLNTLKIISDDQKEKHKAISITDEAMKYGFDLALYRPGNKNLLLGDYGEKLQELYSKGDISEGHYLELRKHIYDGEKED